MDRKKDITIINFSLPASFPDPKNKITVVPIGSLYIVSFLEKRGFSVDFKDYQLNRFKDPLDSNNILSFLANSSDVIGIRSDSHLLPFLIYAIQKLKQKFPGKVVILAGPGPTSVAGILIKNFPFIDVIVKGEGEYTTLDLMRHLKKKEKLDDVKGIVFRKKNGSIKETPLRKSIGNLDRLPFPAYYKLNPEDYQRINMITSRGCPFKCTFCDVAPFWQYHNISRSIDNVIKEIYYFQDIFHFKRFGFSDDNFVLNRKRVLEFCDKFKESGINAQWSVYGRVNLMDDILMEKMSKAGCYGIFFGVESGSNRVLKKIKKGFTVAEARKLIIRSTKYFEKVCASFILDFPFESLNDFSKTIKLMSELSKNPKIITQIFLLTPIASTALYKEYKNTLIFSKEEFGSFVYPIRKKLIVEKGIFDLIKKYPEAFSFFYRFKSVESDLKRSIIKSIGLNI
jgi:radical SAM superfamily enzyme YgiQ (UPF0313 family)